MTDNRLITKTFNQLNAAQNEKYLRRKITSPDKTKIFLLVGNAKETHKKSLLGNKGNAKKKRHLKQNRKHIDTFMTWIKYKQVNE